MDKSKIIPIILLLVILGVGFVAYTFYTERDSLTIANQELKAEKASLVEANSSLQYQYKKLDKERSDMERKLAMVKDELSAIEGDRENWRKKWAAVSKERDELVEKTKQQQQASVSTVKIIEASPAAEKLPEDYWADFVKEKASLEAKVDILNKNLFDEKIKITKFDKENRELSLQMDQLTQEKTRLLEEIKFKERTLRILSMDLVTEKEAKGAVVDEAKKLRHDNAGLKRELIVANKELIKLQGVFKEVADKKTFLEDKIADADAILREKAMAFSELQKQLEKTIQSGKEVTAAEYASVELPPIIVKPAGPGAKELRGEVIAVNHEEKFVVVDIGESSGLRPGVSLKIMRGGKEVGAAEVIEARKEISAADIKEVVSGYTIQEGDSVITR